LTAVAEMQLQFLDKVYMPKNKQVIVRRKAIFGDPHNELPFEQLPNRNNSGKSSKVTDSQTNIKKKTS
jgi:hypothetical protein